MSGKLYDSDRCVERRVGGAVRGRPDLDQISRRHLARLLCGLLDRIRLDGALLLRSVLRRETPPAECTWLLRLLSRLEPGDLDEHDREWIAWAAREYHGELQLVGRPRKCTPSEPAEFDRAIQRILGW